MSVTQSSEAFLRLSSAPFHLSLVKGIRGVQSRARSCHVGATLGKSVLGLYILKGGAMTEPGPASSGIVLVQGQDQLPYSSQSKGMAWLWCVLAWVNRALQRI